MLREQELKNAKERKLNVLNDTLESLVRFNANEDEINDIERLKEEVKYSNYGDHEPRISEIWPDLEYEKEKILHKIFLN